MALDDLQHAGASSARGPRSPRWPVAVVVAGFLLSRIAYRAMGVRFDASPLERFWQLIDPDLLRERLGESLLHLHAQPPLFNAYLGVVLKLFPDRATAVFGATYFALGLVLAVTLYRVMAGLGTNRILALALTTVFVVSPATVLYESWLFYTYPLTVMLLIATLLLERHAESGRGIEAAGLFSVLGAIVLTRNLFHPVWYVMIWVALVSAGRSGRRAMLVAGAVPLVVVAAWQLRGAALPEPSGGGSWVGMNVARMTTFLVPREERARLVAEGTLTELALVAPFSPPEAYRSALPPTPETGVPLLDRERKSTGAVNFHHARYLEIGRSYLRDALRTLQARPAAYGRGLSLSFVIGFFPASDSAFLIVNRDRIRGLDLVFSRALGQIRYAPSSSAEAMPRRTPAERLLGVGWLLVVVYAASIAYGVSRTFKELFRPGGDRARGLVTGFLVFNVLWVLAVGNALELGENNRFRFVVDPLCVVLLASLIDAGLARRRSERSRR